MTALNAFWNSFDASDNTLEDHFSDFAQANYLTTEQVTELRTDIIETLIRYFAQMVEEIHEAEQADADGKLFLRHLTRLNGSGLASGFDDVALPVAVPDTDIPILRPADLVDGNAAI